MRSEDLQRLLPADTFLRQLPVCLDSAQRSILQSLVHAADVLEACYRRAAVLGFDLPQPNARVDRVPEMFAMAWSMVNHLHYARKLLSRLLPVERGGAFEKLMVASEPVSALQARYTAYLAGEPSAGAMGNIPVFGTLKYFAPTEFRMEDGLEIVTGGRTVVLASGTAEALGSEPLDVDPLTAFDRPIHGLVLVAFNMEVEFKPALNALRHLLISLSEAISKQVKGLAALQAADSAESLEALLEPIEEPKRQSTLIRFPA